jgi:uncharacterized protein (DUF1330 family)
MPSYIIANVDVTNPEQYEEYKKLLPCAMQGQRRRSLRARRQGRGAGGRLEPRALCDAQVPSFEQAKAFYNARIRGRQKGPRRRGRHAHVSSKAFEGTLNFDSY